MPLPAHLAAALPYERTDVLTDGGVRLSVVDDGPRDASETILFLHGNPTWSWLWRNLLGPAKDAGHRVVAPDLAGFGASDKPEDSAYYTLPRHVANLEAVAKALSLRDVSLVLHDWGGPIGMGFAARNPGLVKRIVIANTSAFAPKKKRAFTAWHGFFATGIGWWLATRWNAVAWSAMKYGVRKPLAKEVREAYAWPMREKGARIAAARFVRLVPDGPEHPTAAALREYEQEYPKLAEKPMLVLWADRDPVMGPGLAEKWGRTFPRAEVRHVSQAGHFWQEDDPGAFLGPLLEFVRG